jgi:hypothetical protein
MRERVDSDFVPPSGFVAAAMKFAVVSAAQRHGKFVADLAGERAALGKAYVVRIRRPAAADQAGLLGNE